MMDAVRVADAGGTQEATQGIEAVCGLAEQYREALCRARLSIRSPGFEWYPYDTLSSLTHCNHLLRGANRAMLGPKGEGRKILDLGCGDGELAFFLESLGYRVTAVDHGVYNHNGMRGARALKEALGSPVELLELDLDRPFQLPGGPYDFAFLLGILYHLRNPFHVLEELAKHAAFCFLSTRIARRFPGGAPMPKDVALAYLLDETELNNDESNYFVFSEPGLRLALKRTYWDVLDFLSVGETRRSDPVRPDRDERAFCFLRSRFDRLANVELLDGWHEAEGTGWRWTGREFSFRIRATGATRARAVAIDLFLPDSLFAVNGAVTLAGTVNGSPLEPAEFRRSGAQVLVRPLPLGVEDMVLHFRVGPGLAADQHDSRERGVVVVSISVE
ncbi:MAG: class I SAM-dependent methyltransferase [Bryobacteraceae bacterium]